MCMGFCLNVCLGTTCVLEEGKVSDPLELELQTSVSYHVGVGN